MDEDMYKYIGKLQGTLSTVSLLKGMPESSYVLEKREYVCDPLAFRFLDSEHLAELDSYFKKWHLSEEWEEYKEEAVQDWNYMLVPQFKRKYWDIDTCKAALRK